MECSGAINSSSAFHALALAEIGKMLPRTEGAEKGVELLNQALAIYREIDAQSGQANVGIALGLLSDIAPAGDLDSALS